MKQIIILLLLATSSMHLNAQTNDSAVKTKMADAWQLLNSSKKQPTKAFELFTECANMGNAEAMNAIGVQYRIGLGVIKDANKAMDWFKKAAEAGYIKAWYNLGMAYKAQQDFSNAFTSYCKAAKLGDLQSAYAKAYMFYKGLGCTQDYNEAAKTFAQGAYAGKPNSMYFYGLCLRNGYGTKANIDSARYWLLQSANLGYAMAKDELMIKEPEHVTAAGALTEKIKEAKSVMPNKKIINRYQKIEHQVAASDVAGSYSGYLLKYDWSGQHIIEANKLSILLDYKNDSLQGVWTEDDSLTLPIKALLTPKSLVFSQMQYSKKNHYSQQKAELTIFKKANLQLDKTPDGVYLSGNIEQFIPSRNEPAKPLYLALVRTSVSTSKEKITLQNEDGSQLVATPLRAYPNPFGSTISIDFELKETCKVSTEIRTLDGKVVYNNPAGTLQAGNYTLPIQTQQVAAGYYILVLRYGNKVRAAKIIKL